MSAKNDNMIRKLIDAMSELSEPKTSGYDTEAEVRRVEGNIVWVHIPGGVDETPVSRTIDAKVGDTVQVRVSGGTAFLVGNGSAPPTDDTTAIYARNTANTAQMVAEGAQEAAEAVEGIATAAGANAAQAIHLAEGINEHFWHNSTGAHITEDTQEDYEADPANAGGNTLITSQGMAIRKGQTELAVFSASGAQVGQNANGKARSVIDENGMRVFRKSNGSDVSIANLGYGTAKIADGSMVLVPYYSFGERAANSVVGGFSVSEGVGNESSNYCSHAEGFETEASGTYSHAEGNLTHAQGNMSHAEGSIAYATGHISHAEGLRTEARGLYSHAEGSGGLFGTTLASGEASHAEGVETVASGEASHSQNTGTVAQGLDQTAIGAWNVANGSAQIKANTDYAFIIGNGTGSNTRSDAFTVNWDGDVEAAGNIQDGSGNVLSDKIGEDSNGDLTVTRNISAGGRVILNPTHLTVSKSFGTSSERVSLSSGTTNKRVLAVTAPFDGIVFVSGYVTMTSNSNGNRHVTIKVGGIEVYNDTRSAHGTNNGQMGCSAAIPCTAGDTVEIMAWQSSGSTLYAGGRLDAVFL